ncbi:MAG: hypothetical protein CMM00_11375 [Rhodopirellula sp.]|uniref:hypothetical protein n=1 Tax=Rhodopirellula europaea TaxID=1263866 RepID=UPI000C4C651E|nr:hypothetical protein [Rhodopirellula sp.]MCR9211590.1 hypothetical protein [bacterium]
MKQTQAMAAGRDAWSPKRCHAITSERRLSQRSARTTRSLHPPEQSQANSANISWVSTVS